MKQLFEYAALLLGSFFVSVYVGWLATDAFHHVVEFIQNILASA
jgi:hypothetical protein